MPALANLTCVLLTLVPQLRADDWRDQRIIDVDQSPFAKLHPVPVRAVTTSDDFWTPRRRVVKHKGDMITGDTSPGKNPGAVPMKVWIPHLGSQLISQ
jgi:hypothetical protein